MSHRKKQQRIERVVSQSMESMDGLLGGIAKTLVEANQIRDFWKCVRAKHRLLRTEVEECIRGKLEKDLRWSSRSHSGSASASAGD
jgi:hypothetical protein